MNARRRPEFSYSVARRATLWVLAVVGAVVAAGYGDVRDAEAAGFFVTPTVVEAGQSFTFDVAMAGLDSPDGIFVEGTEQAFQIRINVDRDSSTPGNCVATRGFPGGTFTNWGKDWLVTGPDATWGYPNVTPECNGTNGLGPGDYIASLDYFRATGDGSATIPPPIDKKITVLNPIKLSVTSENFITGGKVRIRVDIDGSGEAGTWTASAQSIAVVGPCSGTLTFADGATAWGVDRDIEFPSPGFLGNCGNIGRPGDYFIQVMYRHRFPSGGLGTSKFLDGAFKIRPVISNLIPPLTASQQASIGLFDIIAAGIYGERVTALVVTCPDGSQDALLPDRLQALNEALDQSNPGYSRLWPSASFDGPCDLVENGKYVFTITTLHQVLTREFDFVDLDDPTDSDGDGVSDLNDNCDDISNPGQENFDLDSSGDVCDSDDDNDGVFDSSDNCPMFISSSGFAGADQTNTDADAMGDLCDPDDDNDGVLDTTPDNCRQLANPDQSNLDGDLFGDVCDPDDDNDGLSDEAEQTAGTDPGSPTAFGPGVNSYTDGAPTGSSNPAMTGESVGVVISPPDNVTSVEVTVTDPNGQTGYEETLVPQSPVYFSFTPDIPGVWTISAVFFDGTELVGSVLETLMVNDSSPLLLTVNQAPEQNDPATSSPVRFRAVFSASVAGFEASDVDLSGSTAAGPLVVAVNGSGAVYSIEVGGMSGPGLVVVSVPAGAATASSDGSSSAASTSQDNSVTFAGRDHDGDGVPSHMDNCPEAANPGQADSDGDGRGDACTLTAPILLLPTPTAPAAPATPPSRTAVPSSPTPATVSAGTPSAQATPASQVDASQTSVSVNLPAPRPPATGDSATAPSESPVPWPVILSLLLGCGLAMLAASRRP